MAQYESIPAHGEWVDGIVGGAWIWYTHKLVRKQPMTQTKDLIDAARLSEEELKDALLTNRPYMVADAQLAKAFYAVADWLYATDAYSPIEALKTLLEQHNIKRP